MLPRRAFVASALCLTFFLLAVFHFHAGSAAQSRALSSLAKTAPAPLRYRPGRVLIKFKAPVSNAAHDQRASALLRAHALGEMKPLFERVDDQSLATSARLGLHRIFIAQAPPQTDILALAAALQQDPSVEYAEPDYLMPLESASDIPPLRGARGVSLVTSRANNWDENAAHNHTPLKGGIENDSKTPTPPLIRPQGGNSLAPNDSLYPQQQFLEQVKAPAAWDITRGDSSVIIAIIDSGTEWQHPDLAANIWSNATEIIDGADNDNNGFVDDVRGWDFVDDVTDAMQGEDNDTPDNDPSDFVSHGTGVSGVAAAVTNNARGIAALSWNVKIMPLRVGWLRNDFEGVVSTAFSAAAFVYAADNGAHVANLSAGSSRVVADAAQYAFQKGVVITSAAGNATNEEAFGLNLAPFAITVAAVNDRDEIASYSSYGDWVKVCAPGGDIKKRRPGILTTTLNGNYIEQQGTSFAAPLVASLAALVKSQHREWSPAQVAFQIVETADAIDALNPDYVQGKLGRGRINAQRALTETVTALPEILPGKAHVQDNANQILDAGETVELRLDLQNVWGDAVNLNAQLSTEDYAINILKNTASYGTLPGLSDLSRNVQNNANDPFIIAAHAEALPHRVRFKLDLSAANGYQQSFTFYLTISPFVLLVDDDHGQVNVENFYTAVLDSLGIAFDIYTHPREDAQLDLLARYPNVIWLCEWAFPTLDETDRTALAQYLTNGGKLFISGQDIGWDLSDASPGLFNQFYLSRGASRQFYENFLHARYLSDDANLAALVGVANDPIGDGLNFNIEQPGRTISEQLPSELAPLAPATSIFNYANGRSGAVRNEGNHRVVYFGFGGFEAIVQAPQRNEVMSRVLHWLNGYSIEHTPVRDTDDTTRAQVVLAQINSTVSPLASVALYWEVDGRLPFHRVPMIEQGGGVYRAEIPAQFNRTVEYFIHSRNAQGFASPLKKYSYSTHPDTIPPVITSVTSLPHTLSNVGPFAITVQASDVNGIDTSAAWLHYLRANAEPDSARLQPTATPNQFVGELRGPFHFGDTLRYYASVRDGALRRNRSLSAEKSFVLGSEGFESGLRDWRVDSLGWGVTSARRFSGAFAANSNPGRGYANQANTALTLHLPLDLSHLIAQASAYLQLQEQHYFAANQEDFGVVEISGDAGQSWRQLGEAMRGTQAQWRQLTFDLKPFTGPGFDDVRLRFRVQSDSLPNSTLPGWFIDEVRIVESRNLAVQQPEQVASLPQAFSLHQNFPNPFSQTVTHIHYELPLNAEIELVVFDLMGKRIATLVQGRMAPGLHTATWNGKDEAGRFAPSGIYFCRMRAVTSEGRSFQQVRRVLVLE